MSISSGKKYFKMFTDLMNPKFEIDTNTTFIQKVLFLFKSYLVLFICTLLSVFIIMIIDAFIVKILHQHSIWNEMRNSNSRVKLMFVRNSYLIIAIVIPLIEEIIFRLPLNLKKSSIAISLSILYLRFSGNFLTHLLDITKTEDLIKIIIAVIIFLLLMLILKQDKLNRFKREHFKYIFYFIGVSFGLIHILNFHNINYLLFFFYPIFVLPQILMGLIIGNIRIKYGFIWGWVLHCLINSTSFLLP